MLREHLEHGNVESLLYKLRLCVDIEHCVRGAPFGDRMALSAELRPIKYYMPNTPEPKQASKRCMRATSDHNVAHIAHHRRQTKQGALPT